MMLSHLCQARLWTRPERKAITGAITNDTSHQLKTWPVLNNAIGGICHTEVLSAKETKTDYFLYSRKNPSSSITVPFHANPWNLKENNGNQEESQVFPVNCCYSQISENPAYGLTPAWTDNMQSRYASEDLTPEEGNAQSEQKHDIYEGATENSSESKEVAEFQEELRPQFNLKYSMNSSKIEHIKHYLRSSSNHFDAKPKEHSKTESGAENCEPFLCSENLKEHRHSNNLDINEQFTHRGQKEGETMVNFTNMSRVNSHKSSNNIYEGYRTSLFSGKREKPPLDKLQCGSTFLSRTNRTQNRIYELPAHSNNLVTEQVSEQTLWTESHLPSSNQNHRYNTFYNNDWYQLALPKYQKLPLQKNKTPSPIPSQNVSQNFGDLLQKSSKKNPANISMVIMQCTYLRSHPKENSPMKDTSLPMGSLVAALYKESEWLYVQTPHGEKGFVTLSNCMALGTLTDECFPLTNGVDSHENAQDSENSEEESESDQLVSMEPLQETNYSKLAEVKANCGRSFQKNNIEKIFSMMTKHGLGHVNFNDKDCVNDAVNSNTSQFTDIDKNDTENINCCSMVDSCTALKNDSLLMYKNCLKGNESCELQSENTDSLQCSNVENDEIIIVPEMVANKKSNTSLVQDSRHLEFAESEDINFMKVNKDKLGILDGPERTNKACDNDISTKDYCRDNGGIFSLSISDNQAKITNDKLSISPVSSEVETIYLSSEGNRDTIAHENSDLNHHTTDIESEKKLESLSDKFQHFNVGNITGNNYTEERIPSEEEEIIKENGNDSSSKNDYFLNDIVCYSEESLCSSEQNLMRHKDANSDNFTGMSSILAVIENYNGKEEGTLSVRKGDLVTLLNTVDSEWMWVSSANGIEGYIPSVCTSQVGIF